MPPLCLCRICLVRCHKSELVSMLADKGKLAECFKFISGLPVPTSGPPGLICRTCAADLEAGARVKRLALNYIICLTPLVMVVSPNEGADLSSYQESSENTTITDSELLSETLKSSSDYHSYNTSGNLSAEEISPIKFDNSHPTRVILSPQELQYSDADQESSAFLDSVTSPDVEDETIKNEDTTAFDTFNETAVNRETFTSFTDAPAPLHNAFRLKLDETFSSFETFSLQSPAVTSSKIVDDKPVFERSLSKKTEKTKKADVSDWSPPRIIKILSKRKSIEEMEFKNSDSSSYIDHHVRKAFGRRALWRESSSFFKD